MNTLKALNSLLLFMIISMHTGLYEITSIKGTVIAFMIFGVVLCNIFKIDECDHGVLYTIYRFLDLSVYLMIGTVAGEVVFNLGLKVI